MPENQPQAMRNQLKPSAQTNPSRLLQQAARACCEKVDTGFSQKSMRKQKDESMMCFC
jgi:hypothetical protein